MPRNEKLIAAREMRGWSQTEAAERIGLSRVHLARLEAGTSIPRGSTIGLICQAYQMSAAALGYPHLHLAGDCSLLEGGQAVDLAAPVSRDGHGGQLQQVQGGSIVTAPRIVPELSSVDTAVKQPEPPFDDGQLPPPEYFVGRLEDLEWVMRQVRAGRTTAITALNGLGGIGKTALAAVAVHKLREERAFPDGIAVIFCIGLVDAIDVLRRVLARFDPQRRQPETSDPTALYEVASRLLKGKRSLIVLDNVEPGLDIGKVVAPLKSAGAILLLTSRQALSRAVVPVEASRLLELLSSEDALELFARSLGYHGIEELSTRERRA